ncbi:MAG: hypothetical protein B1H03_00380 [Planctomycetales bacterium 4484_113]|nr:MAG: hypothetical protein B1H03_00380 [Planctomycetales bacterium 4484_113]
MAANGIIVFPTDTVYGLMAAGDPAGATRRLNELKGRDQATPVAALVNATAPLLALISDLDEHSPYPLLELVPGPLTLVIPREFTARVLPSALMALPHATIGFRVPSYPPLNALIERAGGWIMATSANPAGRKETATLRSTLEGLPQHTIDLAIDGGMLEGIPSAVVEFINGGWRILRPHPKLPSEPNL